jgi:hypothetical protein
MGGQFRAKQSYTHSFAQTGNASLRDRCQACADRHRAGLTLIVGLVCADSQTDFRRRAIMFEQSSRQISGERQSGLRRLADRFSAARQAGFRTHAARQSFPAGSHISNILNIMPHEHVSIISQMIIMRDLFSYLSLLFYYINHKNRYNKYAKSEKR